MNFVRKNSLYILLAVSALGVLVATWFEGNATARWGQGNDEYLQSFKVAVENAVPEMIDVWQSDPSLDQIGIDNDLVRRVAGAEGALSRHYVGAAGQPDVQVNITCGFSRSVAAHTPDVCFTGSGSVQDGKVEMFNMTYQVNIPDPENPSKFIKEERTARFKTALFSDADGRYQQRVFWGWKGAETGWVAPRFPRLAWNSNEPICKMYVSLMEGIRFEGDNVNTMKAAEDFLKVFLPELDKILTGKYVCQDGGNGEINSTTTTLQSDSTKNETLDNAVDDFELSIPSDGVVEEPTTTPKKD